MHSQNSSDRVASARCGAQLGNPGLIVTVSNEHRRRVVRLSGDLDLAGWSLALDACNVEDGHDVVVDLGDVAFMDSRGHDALITARERLSRRGMALTLRNVGGQPARLIGLLAVLDANAGRDRTDYLWSGSAPDVSVRGHYDGFNGRAIG